MRLWGFISSEAWKERFKGFPHPMFCLPWTKSIDFEWFWPNWLLSPTAPLLFGWWIMGSPAVSCGPCPPGLLSCRPWPWATSASLCASLSAVRFPFDGVCWFFLCEISYLFLLVHFLKERKCALPLFMLFLLLKWFIPFSPINCFKVCGHMEVITPSPSANSSGKQTKLLSLPIWNLTHPKKIVIN